MPTNGVVVPYACNGMMSLGNLIGIRIPTNSRKATHFWHSRTILYLVEACKALFCSSFADTVKHTGVQWVGARLRLESLWVLLCQQIQYVSPVKPIATSTHHFYCIKGLIQPMFSACSIACIMLHCSVIYLTKKNLKDTSKSSTKAILDRLVGPDQKQYKSMS
jgi:hypothetical protein